MSNTKKDLTLQKRLNQLSEFFDIMTVIFDEEKILYANDSYKSNSDEIKFDLDFDSLFKLISDLPVKAGKVIEYTNNQGQVFWFDCFVKDTVYQEKPAKFAMLHQVSEPLQKNIKVDQLLRLRQLIIEIYQSVLGDKSLPDFLNFVLAKTLQALDRAETGTIMALENNVFHVVASYGYDENIKALKIPKEKSLSYQLTNGAFDRIINIADSEERDYVLPKQERDNQIVIIRSTLSAPIHVDGEFYGMIGLDSFEKNAFNEEDIEALEFIRNSAQIAITNRFLYEEKASLSQFDQVTSLYNRYFFQKQSDFIIKKAKRYNESFHLIMIDIDDLKITNDTYGHVVGDMLIKKIATIIKENTRASDVFGRYGGDEFVGIMFNSTTDQILNKISNIEKCLINHPIQHNKNDISLSISYGIAQYPNDGKEMDELINNADKKMYDRKNTK
jgi:diguanylate cyclase (GGDEF)-like protein